MTESPPAIDAILTFSPWDTWRDARIREFCRPPDQAYRSLLASDRVRWLLVADPWRSGPIDVVRRVQGRRPEFPSSDAASQLRPLGLRRRDPSGEAALKWRYHRYGRRLRRAAVRLGLEQPSVVTFNPFVAAFAELGWCRHVVYYGRDDWTAFARNQKLRAALGVAQKTMRSNGTIICAVSRELADRLAGEGRGIVIPNAIDTVTWSVARSAPSSVAALPRPLGAYAGTVDDRLDVDAIHTLVRSKALASVAILGPIADAGVAERLAAEPGVFVLGPMTQHDLAGALQSADVCLLTHTVTPLTRAMSPLKLYEYLASGAPVVTTDLPPVRNVDERVVIAADGNYVDAVTRALSSGRLTERERLAVVETHSWRRRHETLIDLLVSGATARSRAH
jgi:glycosyltransferase involved in cell wall biosynthesis